MCLVWLHTYRHSQCLYSTLKPRTHKNPNVSSYKVILIDFALSVICMPDNACMKISFSLYVSEVVDAKVSLWRWWRSNLWQLFPQVFYLMMEFAAHTNCTIFLLFITTKQCCQKHKMFHFLCAEYIFPGKTNWWTYNTMLAIGLDQLEKTPMYMKTIFFQVHWVSIYLPYNVSNKMLSIAYLYTTKTRKRPFPSLWMSRSSLLQQTQSVGSEIKTSSATNPIVLTNHTFSSHIRSCLSSLIRSQPLLQTCTYVKQTSRILWPLLNFMSKIWSK